jgi:hypothetical protein
MPTLRELEADGYEFKIDADGYFVSFNGKGLGGAGVRLPRAKPLHWRHRRSNIIDNTAAAISMAEKHMRSRCPDVTG